MNANAKYDLNNSGMAESPAEERRELRHKIAIEVWVEGIDSGGSTFHFGSITKDVSEWGCSFITTKQLEVDNVIWIKFRDISNGCRGSDAPTPFQVARVKRENIGWLVGSCKLNDDGPWSAEIERRVDYYESFGNGVKEPPALRANRRN
jgi:hypothetical protein